jgi:STE24 endopeptidase
MYILSQIFIALVVLVLILKLYLSYRQINSINKHINDVPHNFAKKISLQDHQKAGKYNIAKLKLSIVENILESVMMILFTVCGGIQLINNSIHLTQSPISQGVIVIAIFASISTLINLPFGLYSTFVIEQRFGFNRTTFGVFLGDLVKGIALSIVIIIPLLYLILWFMGVIGSWWWFWTWGVLVVFNLTVVAIYPTFIAPLFNKFTPLTNDILKMKINALLIKCGFISNGIFIMDGSKRSSHGNAYFTGIGNTKRIVFFDTLIKQLNNDEIEAVLAHELGHFKKKHILKQMVISFLLTLAMLFVLSILKDQAIFYNALGVTNITDYNALLLFSILISVVSFPFAPLSSYFSRKNEFEADDFAKIYSNKKDLISGLVKMYKDNASTLTPDPLYVIFYYSHPPASVRIANLESDRDLTLEQILKLSQKRW